MIIEIPTYFINNLFTKIIGIYNNIPIWFSYLIFGFFIITFFNVAVAEESKKRLNNYKEDTKYIMIHMDEFMQMKKDIEELKKKLI